MGHVPSTVTSAEEIVAVLVLLTEFAMLRAPLLRSQVKLYSFQSLAVTALTLVVAVTQHQGALYALAAVTFALKVVAVPGVVLRLLSDVEVDLVGSSVLGVASMTLLALAVAGFGFFAIGALHLRSATLPGTALAIATAVVLVGFLLAVLRTDVVSQAMGFFSVENGISVASLVVAAGLPFAAGVAFLFDLLVAVVVFGVIMRVHHGRARTLSTDELDRLRG